MYGMGLGLLLQSNLLLRFTVRVRSSDRYGMGLGFYYKASYFIGTL